MTASVVSSGSHDDRPRLGELLVAMGVLTEEQLRDVLTRQRETNAPIGRLLVEGGYALPSTVAMALATQHGGLVQTEYGFATGHSAPPAVDRIEVGVEPGPEPEQQPEPELVAEPVAAVEALPHLRLADPVVDQADDRVAELQAELDAARAEAAQIRAQLTELQSAQAQAAIDVVGLRARVAELEPLEAELAALREQAAGGDARRDEIEILTARLAGLDQIQAERDALRAEVAELRATTVDVVDLQSELAALHAQIADLEALAAEAEELQAHVLVAPPAVAPEALYDDARHVLFVATPDGYRMSDREGAAPAEGDLVEIEGAPFVVVRVGLEPVPGSRSACAYLEPVPSLVAS